jgi:site-specific recombinase XerD
VTEPIPLDDLIAHFTAAQRVRHLSPKTIDHYRSTFLDFDRFLAATGRPRTSASLDSGTLQAFSQWLVDTPTRAWRRETTRSISSVHARLRDLRAFTRWLAEEELIPRAPKIVLPKLVDEEFRILSSDDLARLFACHHLTAPGPQAVRNRALFALMLDTGLRRSEVAGIELADLDLDDQLVVVRGKGRKVRRVPFSTGVATYLAAWHAVRGSEEGSFFWLTSNGIYSLFQRINRETGLALHPHALRHTAATMLVRANTDLHTVKRILGHSQLSTTEQYLSLSTADLQAKHAAGSPFEQMRKEFTTPEPIKRKRLALR